MPSAALMQVKRRLAELACPPSALRRRIRELAEHHEDLKHDALEEGLSETEAEARADALLGEPMALAECLAAALRQSSWWGRHPVVGFCLLPPLAILLFFLSCLWLDFTLCNLYLTQDQITDLANEGSGLAFCRWIVLGNYYGAVVLAAVLFSTLARRTVVGFRWALIACIVCALHGIFFVVNLSPHNISAGYWNRVQWPGALIPLMVAFAVWLKLRHTANRLPPLPAGTRLPRTHSAALPKFRKTSFLTPTNVIMILIMTAILSLAFLTYAAYRREHPRHAQLSTQVPSAKPAASGSRPGN